MSIVSDVDFGAYPAQMGPFRCSSRNFGLPLDLQLRTLITPVYVSRYAKNHEKVYVARKAAAAKLPARHSRSNPRGFVFVDSMSTPTLDAVNAATTATPAINKPPAGCQISYAAAQSAAAPSPAGKPTAGKSPAAPSPTALSPASAYSAITSSADSSSTPPPVVLITACNTPEEFYTPASTSEYDIYTTPSTSCNDTFYTPASYRSDSSRAAILTPAGILPEHGPGWAEYESLFLADIAEEDRALAAEQAEEFYFWDRDVRAAEIFGEQAPLQKQKSEMKTRKPVAKAAQMGKKKAAGPSTRQMLLAAMKRTGVQPKSTRQNHRIPTATKPQKPTKFDASIDSGLFGLPVPRLTSRRTMRKSAFARDLEAEEIEEDAEGM